MKEIDLKDLQDLAERDTKNLIRLIALKLWTIQKIPRHEIKKRLDEL